LFTVPVVLGLGFLSGEVAGSGYGNAWFDALDKPEAMPPGWVFGAAWSILYLLLGVALALVLAAPPARARTAGLAFFAAQLALNYLWSPVFFAMHEVGLAFTILMAMLVLSIVTTALFRRVRAAAALLMLPYLAWLCFAAWLTYGIDERNPNARQLVVGAASADIG
jgi:tryptophan-rich sensory protein